MQLDPELLVEGWGAMAAKPVTDPEAAELARCYARLFGTPDGSRVLEHLVSRFVTPPAYQGGNVLEAVSHGLRRDGQRIVLDAIVQQIAIGRSQ